MHEAPSIFGLLRHLWRHIRPSRRGQLGMLLLLMVATAVAEIFSIGAVLPFLGVLTAPERIFDHDLAQPLIRALGISEPHQLLLPLTLAFGLAAILAGALRLLQVWANTRLSYEIGGDISFQIYQRTLYQPYEVHLARNSSEIISGITTKIRSVTNTIILALNFLGAGIIMLAILTVFIWAEPVIALATFGGFGLVYLIIALLTRRQLFQDSQTISGEVTKVVKSLQEGLGGIRDVLLDGSQPEYCKNFEAADKALRRALANSSFVSQSPKFAMEALGMLLIAMLSYALAQQADGINKAIPVLGAMALGAQRLLPILQQAYGAWTGILSGQASLQDTLEYLDQPMPDLVKPTPIARLPFEHEIELRRLSYRYGAQAPWVLREFDLVIPKGSRIGFVGTTGSGKSTLLDIIMGLLTPTEGVLEIDGQAVTKSNCNAWQAHIAHVPQVIYLADSSIEENIAFGVPREQIDFARVEQAARQAQIAEVIEALPLKYATHVGERGVRLSGGQRQRIGIARALYKQADVIVFDEATSALDNETEQAVMQAIEGLSSKLTVLIIAHRLTTLRNCTQIVELGSGGILRKGTYHELFAASGRDDESSNYANASSGERQ